MATATAPTDRAPVVHAAWPAARLLAHAAAHPLPAVRRPPALAVGGVLTEAVLARAPMPAADCSAMDGWAVHGGPPWQVTGAVLAGEPPLPHLPPGTAVAVATGAALPPGTEAVIRDERAAIDPTGLLRPRPGTSAPLPGADIRRCGEEAARGEVLLSSGQLLTPPAAGLAAAGGNDEVLVHRSAAVGVLVLGDELLTEGVPTPGRVRDALGPQLPSWLTALGAAPARPRRVADTLDAVLASATTELDTADVLVSTGGSARGPVDHVRAAVGRLGGRIVVDGVAVRPGHPMILAELPGHRWWVALPGNPLAACAALLTLLQPLLAALHGRPLPPLGSARLATDVFSPADDHRLLPYHLAADGSAHPHPHTGSAMLRGLALSPGLLVIPPGGRAAGQAVDVLAMPW